MESLHFLLGRLPRLTKMEREESSSEQQHGKKFYFTSCHENRVFVLDHCSGWMVGGSTAGIPYVLRRLLGSNLGLVPTFFRCVTATATAGRQDGLGPRETLYTVHYSTMLCAVVLLNAEASAV